MCVPIQRVHRDTAGVLTHIGGSTQGGVPWGLTISEAMALYEARLFSFFVEVPAGQRVSVLVKTSPAGKKYLTTSPDGVAPNNLDSLPDMPNPIAGVEPPFPLSIPGTLTTGLMSITSISYSGNQQLNPIAMAGPRTAGTVTQFNPPTSMWSQQPRWFYLDAIVPFPAAYMVFLKGYNLERVPNDAPARRRALEQAGKGWWTLEIVLTKADGTIDPSKPTRLTEIKAVIRPGSNAWASRDFTLALFAFSINPYCGSGGSSVSIRFKKPQAPPPPPPPSTVTLPSVVGQTLDKAVNTLYGLGLTDIRWISKSIYMKDEKVDSQDPVAGTVVELGQPIFLRVSLVTAQAGVKTIVVSNQSNRAKPMDLWLFDYNNGTWNKKGNVAYQGVTNVGLTDGHTYVLAAVDPTMLNCRTGRPDEAPCVYQSTWGSFLGDSSGIIAPWQIV